MFILVSVAAAFLYGFLDPSFGFDKASLALVVGLFVSIVIATLAFELPNGIYGVANRRRYPAPCTASCACPHDSLCHREPRTPLLAGLHVRHRRRIRAPHGRAGSTTEWKGGPVLVHLALRRSDDRVDDLDPREPVAAHVDRSLLRGPRTGCFACSDLRLRVGALTFVSSRCGSSTAQSSGSWARALWAIMARVGHLHVHGGVLLRPAAGTSRPRPECRGCSSSRCFSASACSPSCCRRYPRFQPTDSSLPKMTRMTTRTNTRSSSCDGDGSYRVLRPERRGA